MKWIDIFEIIKNKILTKNSCLFIVFMFIALVALYSCLTVINISFDYKESVINSYLGRTLIVDFESSNQREEIEKNSDIEVIDSVRYLNGVTVYSPAFDETNNNGVIKLKPLLKENDIRINKGRIIKNNNEIVCPSFFYPHDIYIFNDNNVTKNYTRKYVIKDIMNYNKISLKKADNSEVDFEVVGEYFNNPLEEINTCYVSKKDYEVFKDNIDYCTNDENNNEICYEYTSNFIRLKPKKSIKQIESVLKKNNINYNYYFTFDEVILKNLINIPIAVSIVIVILLLLIVFLWIKNKNLKNQVTIALYKAIGFNYKDIKKIILFETLFLIIISFIVSFITYLIIYKIFSEIYLIDFIYNNYYIKIPYIQMILLTISVLFYIILIDNKMLKSNLKTSINILYKEGE